MNCKDARNKIWSILQSGERRMIRRDPHSPEVVKTYPPEVLDHLESCDKGCKEWEMKIWDSRIASGQIAVIADGQRFVGTPVEVLYRMATELYGYPRSSVTDLIDIFISDRMMERQEDIRGWPNRDPQASALRYFRLLKAEGTLGEFLDPDRLLE